MADKKLKYIIGIDEVGRGAIAGVVTVGAVLMPAGLKIKNEKLKIKLRDSKKLTPKQREIWFGYIKKNQKIFYTTKSISPKLIDKINISNAANLAATRALKKLVNSFTIARLLTKSQIKIFLDGGLYINKLKTKNSRLRRGFGGQVKPKTIIKGDEKIPAIMLASIVAKVSRDREMVKLHKKYPKYGFNKHKGYGTKSHIKAVKKNNPSRIHRLTFLRKIG